MRPNPRRIGILGFDDVTALDIVGPADVFATADQLGGSGFKGTR